MNTRTVGSTSFVRLLGDWRSAEGGRRPAFRALADQVVVLARDGRLPAGVSLPGERDVAARLGVSRSTVTAAYAALREDGYLDSRRGARSTVTLPAAPATPVGLLVPAGRTASGAAPIDLSVAAMAAPPELAGWYAEAVPQLAPYLAGHGMDLAGVPELRRAVADRFTGRGLPTRPEQILVTAGAQQALGLVFSVLLAPGQRVVIDHPTYPHALGALAAAGARPVPVGLRAEPDAPVGWDLDGWRAAIRQTSPSAAYLVADFHNPTGLCLPVAGRRAMHQLARDARTTLIVDETMTELWLDEPAPPPMAAFGPAVTVGSASKAIWGGLRIGWVRADESVITRLAAARVARDLGAPPLEQLVAALALAGLDDLLARRRDLLSRQRSALVRALADQAPDWVATPGTGGMAAWVRLPAAVSSRLAQAALEHGVVVSAGPRFGVDGAFERWLRVPYVLPPAPLTAAVTALVEAYTSITAGPRARDDLHGPTRLVV
ncbi:MocR-like transcription factor YczR [Nakamurella leprariae]|uniref:PLP-dependent aminotransferase family protein n=1 Tax=Nakamurella leprariae TaxID=2803911 RepID=A0A938Y6D2_9ACTN|nr:PLP-dependent aminotransferase family protein [Nakamurella leprariae]MBM9466861.1 PLP-dependent aminotransferase family protein [Nakamurella leprariae]